MDKNELLDLLVSVRERNVDIDTAVNEVCALAEPSDTDSNCNIPHVSGSLPSLDDATKVAVRISEEAIMPPVDAKEQAMFIAGFQECIKWLNVFFGNDR